MAARKYVDCLCQLVHLTITMIRRQHDFGRQNYRYFQNHNGQVSSDASSFAVNFTSHSVSQYRTIFLQHNSYDESKLHMLLQRLGFMDKSCDRFCDDDVARLVKDLTIPSHETARTLNQDNNKYLCNTESWSRQWKI